MNIRNSIRAADTAAAIDATIVSPASTARRAWRAPLAAKLAAALIGLVILVLLVNGAINTWLSYNQARSAALDVQEEKARSAAVRVGEFLADIETQLGWTTGAEWRRTQPDQQRYDFVRLLRQVPGITELSYLDGQGKERLKVSRLEPDSIGSGKDFSNDSRFTQAVANKIWFGPVEFRRGSEPYMTIALAHVGREPAVTVADVNLKLIWDVISAIRVGDKGYAFVVDGKGRLIAHPDLSLVLRDTDFSELPQVKMALKDQAPAEPGAAAMAAPRVGMAAIATAFDGGSVLTAYAVAPRTNWIVFVQLPLAEALAPVYRSLLQTLALLGLGLLLALVIGGLLARRMVVPIRRLQQGAERLGAGDLSERLDIRTGDEIETLSDRFNQMAEKIKESYETLEAKVEARTADLNEALQQQTATADVLKVISRSVFNLQTVFDTLVESAYKLCGAGMGLLYLRGDDAFECKAIAGIGAAEASQLFKGRPIRAGRATAAERVIMTGEVQSVADFFEDPDFDPKVKELVRGAAGSGSGIADFRSTLAVPMKRDDMVIGVIAIARSQTGPFPQRQIELLQTFADQAVIAIENARLFDEVQARTRDLSEALQQQTATADVLKVISRSAFDLQAVFNTLLGSAVALSGADSGVLALRDGDAFRSKSFLNKSPDLVRFLSANPITPGPETIMGRVALSGRSECIEDTLEGSGLSMRNVIRRTNDDRALVGVPLLREARVEGAIVLGRCEPGRFSARSIELAQTFADQAVIAIENVRLFDEVQARTKDLQESLQQQTATADVLKVISRSAFDLQTVLDTLIQSAVKLCGADNGLIYLEGAGAFHVKAAANEAGETKLLATLRSAPQYPGRGSVGARVLLTGEIQNVADVKADPEYEAALKESSSNRGVLGVPLKRGERVIGAMVVARNQPGAYDSRQVEIVQTFADQAVIAIENTRLFDEVQARTKELAASLDDLRKAQDRLVQSEKLASLGQLTAGIAHEIKNPLNFVNNFSALTRELIDELGGVLADAPLDKTQREEADDLIATVASNLDKVVSHGKRADSIVKNMLLHSREGSGERASVNVNAMVEEALNLAYHGARAEKPGFNVTIAKSLDPQAGAADLYGQEMTRVLLNLISNGFYATTKRKQGEANGMYEPTITASTRNLGHSVEIAIRDNGTGIPEEVKAKMFNPFFTTKPAGEGTGLGLSLSHDIVVKQHGGTMEVSTEPGAYTQFTIVVPRAAQGVQAKAGANP